MRNRYNQRKHDDIKKDFIVNNNLIKEKTFIYNTDLVSEDAFNLHLDLYRNYIRQTNNKINDIQLDTYNSNAVILHEWYFENIGEINKLKSEFMIKFFNDNFGSYQYWIENFANLSMEVQSKGWVALIFNSITKKYNNIKLTSHDDGISLGSEIVILSDLFEHNYIQTYNINKKEYVNKFFDCINWKIVEERLNKII